MSLFADAVEKVVQLAEWWVQFVGAKVVGPELLVNGGFEGGNPDDFAPGLGILVRNQDSPDDPDTPLGWKTNKIPGWIVMAFGAANPPTQWLQRSLIFSGDSDAAQVELRGWVPSDLLQQRVTLQLGSVSRFVGVDDVSVRRMRIPLWAWPADAVARVGTKLVGDMRKVRATR